MSFGMMSERGRMGGVGSCVRRERGGAASFRFGAATPIGGVCSGFGRGRAGAASARFGTATPIGGVCSGTGGGRPGARFGETVSSGKVFSKLEFGPLAASAGTGGATPMGGVADRFGESFEVEASAEKVPWRGADSATMTVPIGARRVGGSSKSADSAVVGSSIGGGE